MIRYRKIHKKSKVLDLYLLKKEKTIMVEYGLRNKKDIRKAQALVRKYQRVVRSYHKTDPLALKVFKKLESFNIIENTDPVAEVYELSYETFLKRKLQYIVAKQYDISLNNARQKIVHGLVAVNGVLRRSPNYMVKKDSIVKVAEC